MNYRRHSDTEAPAKEPGAPDRNQRPVAAALVWVLPVRQRSWELEVGRHIRREQRGKRE